MKKKGEKREDKGREDLKSDQRLQAILLADSFEKNFRPLTLENPKVLLPLVNIPMLDYTIEFLAQNGVEELFIFCVWHAEKVQNYVSQSKWMSSMTIRCITSASCSSAGDALRELDSLGVIRSDPFILISGDVISNIDLKKAISFHQEKRRQDPNTVMTVALKTVQKCGVGARSHFDDLVVGMDGSSGQILLFDDSYDKCSVNIPTAIIKEHVGISFRYDLLDCHVDICSPDLMLQFSDNFDYQDIRHDFIKNEVLNWELGMHIYGYIIDHEYAARVHDPRTYHHISRDIVTRWAYPLVPDSQLVNKGTNFVHLKQYNYRDKDSSIARSVQMGECVVIGKGAKLNENVTVKNSIIGPGCVIEENVEIIDSHLWEGCTIHSGTKICKSILANSVEIGENCVVRSGCILSYGVVLASNVTLPENTRVSLTSQDDEENSKLLGDGGKGFIWNMEVDDEDLTDEDVSLQLLLKGHSIGGPELDHLKRNRWAHVPLPDDESDDDYSSDSEGNDGNVRFSNVDDIFRSLVSDVILGGYEDGKSAENTLLEIKGLKFSQNKSFSECVESSMKILMDICLQGTTRETSDMVPRILTFFQRSQSGWCYSILQGLVKDDEDEMTTITMIEDYLIEKEKTLPAFLLRYFLNVLKESGILSKETIQAWISKRREENKSKVALLFLDKDVQNFVRILEDSDDDSDSDSDDNETEHSGSDESDSNDNDDSDSN